MKLHHYLTSYIKVNSKCIKDLRPETVKLLEEKLAEDLLDIVLGNGFLGCNTKSQIAKIKIDK